MLASCVSFKDQICFIFATVRSDDQASPRNSFGRGNTTLSTALRVSRLTR
jgi:hypothetical protein